MSVLLVTYDFHKPDRDYKPLYEALKQYTWCHAQESVWFLDTYQSTINVRDALHAKMHPNDKLFVVRLHRDWATVHTDFSTEWLNHPNRTWD